MKIVLVNGRRKQTEHGWEIDECRIIQEIYPDEIPCVKEPIAKLTVNKVCEKIVKKRPIHIRGKNRRSRKVLR